MTTLTIPGTIPGLLRLGSIVVSRLGGGQGVVVGIDPDRDEVCVAWVGHDQGPSWMPRDRVALDLTDPTSRAHAAWWLLSALPISHYSGIHSAASLWLSPRGAMDRHVRLLHVLDAYPTTLGHLDPNDPRLLPDGSRWVDAEALRLVCLHVAGLPS